MGIHLSQTFSYARGFLGLQWFSIWYLQWRSFTWSEEHVKVSRSTSGHGVSAHLLKSISYHVLELFAAWLPLNTLAWIEWQKQLCPKIRNVLLNLLWNSLSIYLKISRVENLINRQEKIPSHFTLHFLHTVLKNDETAN